MRLHARRALRHDYRTGRHTDPPTRTCQIRLLNNPADHCIRDRTHLRQSPLVPLRMRSGGQNTRASHVCVACVFVRCEVCVLFVRMRVSENRGEEVGREEKTANETRYWTYPPAAQKRGHQHHYHRFEMRRRPQSLRPHWD